MGEMIYRGFTPDLEVRGSSDGRTVVGIAVPYGRKQRIHEGLTESFARGAFAHQLAAAHRVKFARGHQTLGGALIGRADELREDAAGLWGSFRVSKTPAGDETLELIRDGALDELSVGFRERRNRTLPDGSVERSKADLFEVSAVPEGAYGRHATVKGIREGDTDDGVPVEHEPGEVEQVTPAGVVVPGPRTRAALAAALLASLQPV